MYIHGELKRYGFELTEVHSFGNMEKGFIKYEFKNSKINASIYRYFNGRVILTYVDQDNSEKTEFIDNVIKDEPHIIELVRTFLRNHA